MTMKKCMAKPSTWQKHDVCRVLNSWYTAKAPPSDGRRAAITFNFAVCQGEHMANG